MGERTHSARLWRQAACSGVRPSSSCQLALPPPASRSMSSSSRPPAAAKYTCNAPIGYGRAEKVCVQGMPQDFGANSIFHKGILLLPLRRARSCHKLVAPAGEALSLTACQLAPRVLQTHMIRKRVDRLFLLFAQRAGRGFHGHAVRWGWLVVGMAFYVETRRAKISEIARHLSTKLYDTHPWLMCNRRHPHSNQGTIGHNSPTQRDTYRAGGRDNKTASRQSANQAEDASHIADEVREECMDPSAEIVCEPVSRPIASIPF